VGRWEIFEDREAFAKLLRDFPETDSSVRYTELFSKGDDFFSLERWLRLARGFEAEGRHAEALSAYDNGLAIIRVHPFNGAPEKDVPGVGDPFSTTLDICRSMLDNIQGGDRFDKLVIEAKIKECIKMANYERPVSPSDDDDEEELPESVVGDKKASRWARILRRRSKSTGTLPSQEMMDGMGVSEDDDFWKQDNSDPAKGFVVNLSVRISDLLSGEAGEVVGTDDFDNPVTHLPTRLTGELFDVPITSSYLRLLESPPDPELGVALRDLAKLMKHILENKVRGVIVYAGPDAQEVFDQTITRLWWDAKNQVWQVMFEDPEDD